MIVFQIASFNELDASPRGVLLEIGYGVDVTLGQFLSIFDNVVEPKPSDTSKLYFVPDFHMKVTSSNSGTSGR